MNDGTIEFPGQKPIKRAADRADAASTRVAKDQLISIVERIERLEEEKKTIADDIKDVYAEAKGNGYEVKALRRIVRLRRLDGPQKAAHAEVESILETYMAALGML
jgi:uncharacterized protein (UPF0335 family)